MEITDPFLGRLMELWSPPSRRFHTGLLMGFESIERDLGMALPTSFKELTHAYGQGVWFETIFVLNPFYAKLNDLTPWLCGPRGYAGGLAWCDGLRKWREDFPRDFIYPICPEPGGVFPWAFLQDGGELYWLTSGPADSWKTLAGEIFDQETWGQFEMSATELLWRLALDDPAVAKSGLAGRVAPFRSVVFTPLG
jgi:hypothetical protein